MQRVRFRISAAASALATSACGAAPGNGQAATAQSQVAVDGNETKVAGNDATTGRQFRDLDEYLSYLQATQGPIDGPWYREIRPGIYQLQTGNLRLDDGSPRPKLIYSREELERKFGFKK